MHIFVKICGICSRSDLEQISAFQPDAIGFVQWEQSKRYIAPETVGQWDTPDGIKRVGVFVDPTDEELQYATETARLDVLQLHRVAFDREINRSDFNGVEFWRAINPDELKSMEDGFQFDRYVLDSYDPETIGGTGKTCDWNQACSLVKSSAVPILLAGGLTSKNVAEAMRLVQPWGVDVSSGVEIEPGVKKMDKVEAFIAACRTSCV